MECGRWRGGRLEVGFWIEGAADFCLPLLLLSGVNDRRHKFCEDGVEGVSAGEEVLFD